MDLRRRFSRTLQLVVLLFACASNCFGCEWDKDLDFPEHPPLIINNQLDFVLPVLEGVNRVVRVAEGETVTLACSGSELVNLGEAEVQARCLSSGLLTIGDAEWDLASLGCSSDVKETIFRDLGTCGAGGVGILNGIGFQIFSLNYDKVIINVCFEAASETTLFTDHILHGADIAAKDVEASRPSFKTSTGFFSVSMNTVYSQNSQLQLMTSILGDEDPANTIIDPSKQLYFAKGHMSPDAGFVTIASQDATYYFINALPQWQAFNNGNWKYLETNTRNLAMKKGRDLRVYSGGWDVLELDDINGNPVKVFLGLTEGKEVVPAPAITWKVVHDESTNCAVAVVGVNNPHLTAAPATLCEDLCSSLSWITFDVSSLASGYTYRCSVAELRASVPHVPDLGNVCLLTD
uniref:Putative non-specific nuclease n=1 Tax=Paraleptuca crassipes TaxID=399438 RepID=Q0GIJ2_PARCS|nr:putative non-specific nuclease [Paraleptuca crassipes]